MIKIPIILKEEKVEGTETPNVKVTFGSTTKKELEKATDNEVLVAKQLKDYLNECLLNYVCGSRPCCCRAGMAGRSSPDGTV